MGEGGRGRMRDAMLAACMQARVPLRRPLWMIQAWKHCTCLDAAFLALSCAG